MNRTAFKTHLICFLTLTLLGVLIYSNTFQATFHFDDTLAIVQSEAIKSGRVDALWNEFNTRFIVGLSLAMNYALGKLNVLGYHLFNISCHLLSSFLVYFLVLLTFDTPLIRKTPLHRHKALSAFSSSLIFLVHPIQTQGVNYIWQRAASLATFFYLVSLVFYMKARLANQFYFYVGSYLSALLGMFTKEITFTLPFMVVLYELFFLGRLKEAQRKRILLILPFLFTLMVIPFMLLRSGQVTSYLMQSPTMTAPRGGGETLPEIFSKMTSWMASDEISRKEYLLTQLNVLKTYLRLLFFPVNQNLDYDFPIARAFNEPETLFSFFLLVLLLSCALWLFQKQRLIALGIFWFLMTLSVESSVVMSDVIFEHRLYLPMVGFALFLPVASHLLLKDKRSVVAFLSVVVLVFSVASYRRNAIWKDEITLWQDVVKKSPHKARPHYNLGTAYLNQGDLAWALDHFQKAIQLNPRYAGAYNNLGVVHLNQDHYDRAIEYFQKAVELNPNFVKAYNNLGVAHGKKGHYDETILYCQKAIQLDPSHADGYNHLCIAYGAKGDYDKAITYCLKAIQRDPSHTGAHSNLGIAYVGRRDIAGSLKQVSRLRALHREDLAERLEQMIHRSLKGK